MEEQDKVIFVQNRFSTRRLNRGYETLETRAMFASLAGANIGASCPAFAGTGNIESDLFSESSTKVKSKPEYTYSISGNAGDKNVAPTGGGLALMGGGTEVDEAFRWLADKANGGDFVVLGATSTQFYNKYISDLASLDSVETLIIPTFAAANADFVYEKIAHAEAIFIKGGDQSDYINYWSGSRVEDALYVAMQRHVPIGGSSAGLAVLGEVDFAALNDSITSSEALANPLDGRISLDAGFLTPEDAGGAETALQLVDNVIMDTHFMQRDRMGRMLTFMARMDSDNLVPATPRGIAVNEQTALLVSDNGSARAVGNLYAKKIPVAEQQRSVYLLEGAVDAFVTEDPLTYRVHAQRATYDPLSNSSDAVDLPSWEVAGASLYEVSASSGELSSSSGSIYA